MLANNFEKVWHLAYLHEGVAPNTYTPYSSGGVEFVALHPAGGHGLSDKLKVIGLALKNLAIIEKYLDQADAAQLRLPTGMGVYLLPWISWRIKRSFKLWIKYAGNWKHPHPPITYRFQRWFLIHNFQHAPVTINGSWPDQPSHCYTFENPCLTDAELNEGKEAASPKNFEGPLRILFVGRMEPAKGVDKILNMLHHLPSQNDIADITLAGEGDLKRYRELAETSRFPIHITGGIHRRELNKWYASSHLLILPSDSEGFPKVVAEAAAFGCVPVVSNVSSIGQYINASNGLLLSSVEPKAMAIEITELLRDRIALKKKSTEATAMAEKFTYSYYNKRILNEVLGT
jgi:glycosyltransferase involved in cell wall biosynthesis